MEYVGIEAWVKLESWHVVNPAHPDATVCGIAIEEDDPTSDELPGEKSCENCLRIVARRDHKEG